MADNAEKLITEDDWHHVIIQLKAIVGSSGSVWPRIQQLLKLNRKKQTPNILLDLANAL